MTTRKMKLNLFDNRDKKKKKKKKKKGLVSIVSKGNEMIS